MLTLEGIDQAIENLGLRKDGSPKARLISAIRALYDEAGAVEEIQGANPDDLIRAVWRMDGDPEILRKKRKNLHTLRSAINSDLMRLYKEGKNPEGIIIGPQYVFTMSEEAKDNILDKFATQIRENGGASLSQISEVLGFINKLLSDSPLLDGAQDEIDALKGMIRKISQGLGFLPEDGGERNVSSEAPQGHQHGGELQGGGTSPENEGTGQGGATDLAEGVEIIEDEDIEIPEEEVVVEEEEAPGLEVIEEPDEESLQEIVEEVDGASEIEPAPEDMAEELAIVEGAGPETEGDELQGPTQEQEMGGGFPGSGERKEAQGAEGGEGQEKQTGSGSESAPETYYPGNEIGQTPAAVNEDGGVEGGKGVSGAGGEGDLDDMEDPGLDEEGVNDNILTVEEEIQDDEAPPLEIDELLEEEAGATEEPEPLGLEEALGETGEEQDTREKARLLAEAFDGYLGAMDRYYNQYLLIPGGEYLIGDPSDPYHQEQLVSLSPFYMAKFPVTNALFEIFVEKTGYVTTAEKQGYGIVYEGRYRQKVDPKTGRKRFIWHSGIRRRKVEGACWYQPSGPGSNLHGKRNHPVVQVSLEDAMAFAAWTGKRLPTEAEWEGASRTRKGYPFPWGQKWLDEACNVESSLIADTTPVEKYKDFANELGITDSLGNVMEWTQTTLGDSTYVVKGGGWLAKKGTPLWSRAPVDASYRSNILGFRCVAY